MHNGTFRATSRRYWPADLKFLKFLIDTPAIRNRLKSFAFITTLASNRHKSAAPILRLFAKPSPTEPRCLLDGSSVERYASMCAASMGYAPPKDARANRIFHALLASRESLKAADLHASGLRPFIQPRHRRHLQPTRLLDRYPGPDGRDRRRLDPDHYRGVYFDRRSSGAKHGGATDAFRNGRTHRRRRSAGPGSRAWAYDHGAACGGSQRFGNGFRAWLDGRHRASRRDARSRHRPNPQADDTAHSRHRVDLAATCGHRRLLRPLRRISDGATHAAPRCRPVLDSRDSCAKLWRSGAGNRQTVYFCFDTFDRGLLSRPPRHGRNRRRGPRDHHGVSLVGAGGACLGRLPHAAPPHPLQVTYFV